MYVPIVVPGLGVIPPPLFPPLHPVTAAMAMNRTAAKITTPRRSRDAIVRRNMQISAAAISDMSNQFGACRWLGGKNKWLAAVVLTVSVAVPVSEFVASVIVPGAVKFESGAPKLQPGKSVALPGVMLSPQESVTAPLKLFAPVTVIKHVPDCPAAAIVMVAEAQPGVILTPLVPTLMVTDGETALAE